MAMTFQKLRVTDNGRHIINDDGSPFFYLADTAWELFHRLNREDIAYYLKTRAEAGFTAVQAVALAEFEGIRTPNAYGRYALKQNDRAEWDVTITDTDAEYSYWDHVDFAVEEAAKNGMYIALLPTWGDKFNRAWGAGPELFNPDNAYTYGRWIGSRYRDHLNIIWLLGGDRQLVTRRHCDIINNMALGVREGDGGAHLISFHPTGGQSSATPLHDETWLDFNMIQSGHDRKRNNYEMITHDYNRIPIKPVIDGEPGYEDHPDAFNPENGYLDAADARQFAYMSLFSGACGHTYGNHSCWGFIEELPVEGFQPAHFCKTWRQAINSPGAGQMRHAKDLLLQHDFLSGEPRPDLIEGQLKGVLHIPVLKGNDYLLAYTSQGQIIRLKQGCMDGSEFTASWYDPRVGSTYSACKLKDDNPHSFTPPSGGRGNDWVLVLEK